MSAKFSKPATGAASPGLLISSFQWEEDDPSPSSGFGPSCGTDLDGTVLVPPLFPTDLGGIVEAFCGWVFRVWRGEPRVFGLKLSTKAPNYGGRFPHSQVLGSNLSE